MKKNSSIHINPEKAYAKMAHLCSKKEYCRHEIQAKLRRMPLSEDEIDKIVEQLEKERFIDEPRYAKSFIHDKLHFSRWGKIKIAMALRQKGISSELIDKAFSEFSPDKLTDALQPLLTKKMKTVKATSEYEKRAKLIRFALGKGFEMDDIIRCVDRLFTK